MALILSYFLIPLVLLLLIVNVIFRVKIIRQYKILRKHNIDLGLNPWIHKKEVQEKYGHIEPEVRAQLIAFSTSLKRLLIFTVVGFAIIVVFFVIIYFKLV